MSDSTSKPKETSPNKLTKDYGEFGKIEVIDLSEEIEMFDVLGAALKRD